MGDTIIKVENLSKLYRLGEVGTGTLSHDLNRWWAKVRGRQDPFARIGESNDRTLKGSSDYVWSLKDIDFEVKRGEVLGIIGRNGAGKSTLLKLLSKITSPTTGAIKIKGRVASLLEVGTGFHPELTGRENIFLNGAILGMTRDEIKHKFEEIVDFAGVERYIDTPVKRYSSGMYVRLAFAVAAHLEPEILIVDEVLAVGDAEFQKKCIDKMGNVALSEGKTILFVSHNLAAVQKLCNKGLLLENGKLKVYNNLPIVLDKYLESLEVITSNSVDVPFNENSAAFAYRMVILDSGNNPVTEIPIGETWKIELYIKININVQHFVCAVGLVDQQNTPIGTGFTMPQNIEPGSYKVVFQCNNIMLASGLYNIYIGLSSYERSLQSASDFAFLRISDVIKETHKQSVVRNQGVGVILNLFETNILNVND